MGTGRNYVGKKVTLRSKLDGNQTARGTIVSDPPKGETRFRLEDGTEVGANEWYYRVVD